MIYIYDIPCATLYAIKYGILYSPAFTFISLLMYGKSSFHNSFHQNLLYIALSL